jgi:GDPmannose 4,6-dehydratase
MADEQQKVLVTGVTGQTGSYLAELLTGLGWKVHGVGTGNVENALPEGVIFHQLDLVNSAEIRDLVYSVSPDVVVNLAAMSSVAQAWKEPQLVAHVNAMAVATLLDTVDSLSAAKGAAVKFVQASSGEMFSLSGEMPQTELTRLAPSNPYGASKAYSHLLTQAYRTRGLHASSCILYNHESPRRPESFVTRKITASVARISAGLQEKLVLGSLDVKRDWGWAPDYAQAISLMMMSDTPDDYIVATGEAHTVREFVETAFAVVGIPDWQDFVETDPAFVRLTDSPELRGDASKIRRKLGWIPSHSFEELVTAMVNHDLKLLS